jgi:tetraacyldisaccharide 4'-kinase
LLYALIVVCRNYLFDKNYLKSSSFNFPIICVGNLAAGGTGKSPMVEYLLRITLPHFKTATLSRGYKRKTTGFAIANAQTTALEIGDEPMQFHIKFPDAIVSVGEERLIAIPELLQEKPATELIILDDAFQHRTVKAGLNILLTEHDDLFTRDFFLPTGDLRDQRSSYKRAEIIVVTKCPPDINEQQRRKIIKEINPLEHQQIFFTTIQYGKPYHIIQRTEKEIEESDEVLLVCGIANPKPLKKYISEKAETYYEQMFQDHHIFSIDDLNEIIHQFNNIDAPNKIIITTEKDAVRLIKFKSELSALPLYVLPIEHVFLFDEAEQFQKSIISYVKNFPKLIHE